MNQGMHIPTAVALLTALLLAAADAAAYTCSVTVADPSISFGNLDPGIGLDVSDGASITVRCSGAGGGGGVTFAISDDDGMHETGLNANRMMNAGCPLGMSYLPYRFTYTTPVSGPKNKDIAVTFTGLVLGTIYQNACVGAYSDTVTVTITP